MIELLSHILSFFKSILLTGYIQGPNSFPPPLSAKEEEYYIKRYLEGDEEAKTVLIERNLRLVAHIVKKYSSLSKGDSEDLISIGTIGLIKAINSFDAQKSKKLSTYASKCIQNELLMSIRSSKKHQHDVYLQDSISVDKEGNSIALIDLLCSDNEDVTDSLFIKMKISKMNEVMEKELTEREREIINMRYGLNGSVPQTQFEISKVMGISRSYVSRIEKKALEKLKREFDKADH